MDTNESNSSSKSIINNVAERTVKTTNESGIMDKHLNENKMKNL